MKSFKKLAMALCFIIAIMLAMLGATLTATVEQASAENLSNVTSTESMSKKAALILLEENVAGVYLEPNQWLQYGYDLTTLSEYDYLQISFESSATVVLLEDANITYQYSTLSRYMEVAFQANANAIDYNNLAVDNVAEGEININMAVCIDGDVVQSNEYRISLLITPYGNFSTPYDMQSAIWFYNEWLFEQDIITY